MLAENLYNHFEYHFEFRPSIKKLAREYEKKHPDTCLDDFKDSTEGQIRWHRLLDKEINIFKEICDKLGIDKKIRDNYTETIYNHNAASDRIPYRT